MNPIKIFIAEMLKCWEHVGKNVHIQWFFSNLPIKNTSANNRSCTPLSIAIMEEIIFEWPLHFMLLFSWVFLTNLIARHSYRTKSRNTWFLILIVLFSIVDAFSQNLWICYTACWGRDLNKKSEITKIKFVEIKKYYSLNFY